MSLEHIKFFVAVFEMDVLVVCWLLMLLKRRRLEVIGRVKEVGRDSVSEFRICISTCLILLQRKAR